MRKFCLMHKMVSQLAQPYLRYLCPEFAWFVSKVMRLRGFTIFVYLMFEDKSVKIISFLYNKVVKQSSPMSCPGLFKMFWRLITHLFQIRSSRWLKSEYHKSFVKEHWWNRGRNVSDRFEAIFSFVWPSGIKNGYSFTRATKRIPGCVALFWAMTNIIGKCNLC